MKNYYTHMQRDAEADLVAYIMGLWHMHKIHKMVANKLPAYKGK